MRWVPRLAVLTAGVAAALTLAAPSSSASAGTLDLQEVPAGFAQVMGYAPVIGKLADGTERVINPRGNCSVPGEGRPFNFDIACKAHDYGYDRLRYAARTGYPLPPAAREQIDHQFTHDLLIQCKTDTSIKTCDMTVAVFTAGVAFNSWRQLSGPPKYSAGLTRTAGLVLLAGVGVSGGLKFTRRKRVRSVHRQLWIAGSSR